MKTAPQATTYDIVMFVTASTTILSFMYLSTTDTVIAEKIVKTHILKQIRMVTSRVTLARYQNGFLTAMILSIVMHNKWDAVKKTVNMRANVTAFGFIPK